MNDIANAAEFGTVAQIELIAHIASAYVSNNPTPATDLPALISNVAASLNLISSGAAAARTEKHKPAVPIRKSITPDYIISLEDGMKFKSLKRPLSSRYGLTPNEYRAKWGLPKDSDGSAELRCGTLGIGEENGARPQGRAKGSNQARPQEGRIGSAICFMGAAQIMHADSAGAREVKKTGCD